MKIDENIIVFAARYAHSRQTGAPLMVVSYILSVWDSLSDAAKKTLLRECEEAQYCQEDWDRLRERGNK